MSHRQDRERSGGGDTVDRVLVGVALIVGEEVVACPWQVERPGEEGRHLIVPAPRLTGSTGSYPGGCSPSVIPSAAIASMLPSCVLPSSSANVPPGGSVAAAAGVTPTAAESEPGQDPARNSP